VRRCWRCEADGVWPREASRSTIIPPVAEDERRRSDNRDFLERRSYEPRLALRRVQRAVLALVIITAVGILGTWSSKDGASPTLFTLHIVARASSDESAAKLEIAGADRTLSPYAVGGRRLASLATQPLVVDFLDVVTRGEKGIEFRLEEFFVPEHSTIAEHTIGDLKIGERTGTIVLAIRTTEGNFDTTPSADDRLRAGDTLIVLGSRGQIERLEQLMRGEEVV
jgi:hypothetical protein